jgi:site-specific recombinase XerD
MTPITMSGHDDHQAAQHCNALSLYLDNLAPSGRRSMRSLLQQVAVMNGWSGTLESMPWLSLRYQQVAKVRAEFRLANKSPKTINTTLAAIRGVLKSGFLIGHYPAIEWQRIQAIPNDQGRSLPSGRALQSAEIAKLFKPHQNNVSITNCRDAAVLALLAYAGLRRSEVASINLADYDRRSGRLVIEAGKGGRQRELLLPTAARTYMRQWLQYRRLAPGPLFCRCGQSGQLHVDDRITAQVVYRILKVRARDAGIDTCSPHDLRRTFVTRLLEQGVDINTTRQLAGHEQVQTTALYDRRSVKTQQRAMANFRF